MDRPAPAEAPPDAPAPPAQRPGAGFYLRMLLVPVIWGGAFVPGKIAVHGWPPGGAESVQALPAAVASCARYLVACAGLLLAAFWLEGGLPRPRGRQWLGVAALGLTGIAPYNLLMFKSFEHIDASRTALIVAVSPALIALGAWAMLGQPMGPRRWAGVALALAGAWLVLCRGHPLQVGRSVGLGEAYMLMAVLCWAAYTLISRRVLGQGLSVIATTTWSSLVGTAALVPPAILAWPARGSQAASAAPWLSVALMGALGTTVAFIWYAEGIRRIGPAGAAVFTNLVPVFALLGAALVLREHLHWSLLAGGAVTLVGVGLVNWVGRR